MAQAHHHLRRMRVAGAGRLWQQLLKGHYYNHHYCTSTPAEQQSQMSLIRQLRERSSAPIKDVKSALVGCNWDLDAALTLLRKRGVVLAAKKSSRTAAEGLLALAQHHPQRAVLIELNCETDFVARNDLFRYLASTLATKALLMQTESPPPHSAFPFSPEYFEGTPITLDHPKLSGDTTVQGAVTEVAAMVG